VVVNRARSRSGSSIPKTKNVAFLATEATFPPCIPARLQRIVLEATEKRVPAVPLVEEGGLEHPVTETVAHIYMTRFSDGARDADVLVLGAHTTLGSAAAATGNAPACGDC